MLGQSVVRSWRQPGIVIVKFISTRDRNPGHPQQFSLDEALSAGIAPDGGLFMPTELPSYSAEQFSDTESIKNVAIQLLAPFFTGSVLNDELVQIVDETFAFPIPTRDLCDAPARLQLLELFHGPTAAFKDIGAAFLAACLRRLEGQASTPLTILVATSGDTGGAVAAAFNEQPGVQVAVLFPDGRVSERQAQQLTCWGDNVLSLAVRGTFDDCQALVKSAMADIALAAKYRFSSANSINIGRLLPQSIYYASSSLQHFNHHGRWPGFIIPTGNLGNGLACVLARDMGFPVGDIVLATNENQLIPDYLAGAEWLPRNSKKTLASAMDVGDPSNMERLRFRYEKSGPLVDQVRAIAVTDEEISEQVKQNMQAFGVVTCPHTATATFAWHALPDEERRLKDWIAVATAHPAKFEQIIEPLIGTRVEIPAELERLLSRPSRSVPLEPDVTALDAALDTAFGPAGCPNEG